MPEQFPSGLKFLLTTTTSLSYYSLTTTQCLATFVSEWEWEISHQPLVAHRQWTGVFHCATTALEGKVQKKGKNKIPQRISSRSFSYLVILRQEKSVEYLKTLSLHDLRAVIAGGIHKPHRCVYNSTRARVFSCVISRHEKKPARPQRKKKTTTLLYPFPK